MIHISTIMYHLMMSVALKLLEILYRDINIWDQHDDDPYWNFESGFEVHEWLNLNNGINILTSVHRYDNYLVEKKSCFFF